MTSKIIAYYRVSTDRQGQSGLGLEAQQAAVQKFALTSGSTIDSAYTEVESGRSDDRPEIAKALAHARRIRGRLVIAKLDRLARKVSFVSALMDAGVEFTCCDNPTANRLTLHILAAVAEDEAVRIGERTKAALAAAKARGQLLGAARPGFWDDKARGRRVLRGLAKGRAVSLEKRRLQATESVCDLLPAVQQMRDEGKSLEQIAQHLNETGRQNSTGRPWHRMGVKRLLDRASGE